MAQSVATATKTINHHFADRVAEHPDRVALRRKVAGKWEDVSWKGYRDAARKIGLGLIELGLERGQAVALLAETRAEWAFCDMGILGVGGVTVPIYHSSLSDAVEFILTDSESRYLILENLPQWAKIQPQLDALGGVKKFILIDTDDTPDAKAADFPWEGDDRVITLDALIEMGEAVDAARFDELSQATTLEDTLTLIYTSGTTGLPKGSVLTHECAASECEGLAESLAVDENDLTLAFLPLAHVFARVLHWTQLRVGYQVAFAEGITEVVGNMGEVKPTFFAAVPRLYEKIHAAVMAKINSRSGFGRNYPLWALDNALAVRKLERQGKSAGVGLKFKRALGGPALGKVAASLQERTGGRIRLFVSGGAPLSPEIADFLWELGLPIYEGYGLTETTAATHVNSPGACKVGTVGRVIRGAECKIAADGEILLKGGMIMKCYHNQPEATAEAIKDGWFHTGDIGVIDSEGFLKITDRKKDLIITAAGKNIAPQVVENHIKTHPLVSQVAMFGDQQKFCVALITLDEEAGAKALEHAGVANPPSGEELTQHPKIRELMQAAIDGKNADLPSYETIKYFEILAKDFEVGHELTPTLKVKRKVVKEKYGDLVEKLYASATKK